MVTSKKRISRLTTGIMMSILRRMTLVDIAVTLVYPHQYVRGVDHDHPEHWGGLMKIFWRRLEAHVYDTDGPGVLCLLEQMSIEQLSDVLTSEIDIPGGDWSGPQCTLWMLLK